MANRLKRTSGAKKDEEYFLIRIETETETFKPEPDTTLNANQCTNVHKISFYLRVPFVLISIAV